MEKAGTPELSCSMEAGCQYFLTTDDKILKRMADQNAIQVLNPLDFVKQIEDK